MRLKAQQIENFLPVKTYGDVNAMRRNPAIVDAVNDNGYWKE